METVLQMWTDGEEPYTHSRHSGAAHELRGRRRVVGGVDTGSAAASVRAGVGDVARELLNRRCTAQTKNHLMENPTAPVAIHGDLQVAAAECVAVLSHPS